MTIMRGNKFKVVSLDTGIEYSSEDYDIFFFQETVEIYEKEEHIHTVEWFANDKILEEWEIEIIK
jgi:hypothetical protein